MPNDNDLVSTLGARQTNAPTMILSPNSPFQLQPQPFQPHFKCVSSPASVSSETSAVTMESIQTIQSQLETLNARMNCQELNTQSKFDQLISLMSLKSDSSEKVNSPCQGQSNAGGGDSASVKL